MTDASPEGPRIVRVLPDIAGVHETFDYRVPETWRADGRARYLVAGTVVRMPFSGRRVRGWIAECDPSDAYTGGELSLLTKLVGAGPAKDVMELSRWAARRWAGAWCFFVNTATAPRVIPLSSRIVKAAGKVAEPDTGAGAGGSEPDTGAGTDGGGADGGRGGADTGAATASGGRKVTLGVEVSEGKYDACFSHPVSVVRIPPAEDLWPVVEAALRRTDPLMVVPTLAAAVRLTERLRRAGRKTAHLPDNWRAAAAGGAAVVGTRSAVFGPSPRLGAVVVFDEHDGSLTSERSPTWHAREVAVERARRCGVPCVLTSPVPTLEALQLASPGAIFAPTPEEEKAGWPELEIVDLRNPEHRRTGLLTEALVKRLRESRRAVCVLNRKGRARLLACGACRELVRCDECSASVSELEAGRLTCGRCDSERPRLCSFCGSMRLKAVRPGISRLADDLRALLRTEVAEVSRERPWESSDARVLIGTEAAIYQAPDADLVAFLDLDPELTAPRFRANEQAMAQLARASRLLGRSTTKGRLMIGTRLVDHVVIRSIRESSPEILSDYDRSLRRRLQFPPFGALAEISGDAAPEFVRRLGSPEGIAVSRLEKDGKWIVRAPNPEALSDLLNGVERPKGRLRVGVDSSHL